MLTCKIKISFRIFLKEKVQEVPLALNLIDLSEEIQDKEKAQVAYLAKNTAFFSTIKSLLHKRFKLISLSMTMAKGFKIY